MDFAQQQRNPGRHLIGFGIVVALHVLLGWALVTGLAQRMIEVIKAPIETKIIEEVKPPEPPPPENLPPPPKFAPPPPSFVPPPEVNVAPPPTPAPTITTTQVAPPVLWLSLLNAIACTALPVLLVMMAIERIGPALTAQTGMIGPMATILMGVLILGEPLNSWIIAGTVLVVTGIFMFSRSARQA